MKTKFNINGKLVTLKYQRKMSEGEVKKMKSFVTNKGDKLVKTSKFKIKNIRNMPNTRVYSVLL